MMFLLMGFVFGIVFREWICGGHMWTRDHAPRLMINPPGDGWTNATKKMRELAEPRTPTMPRPGDGGPRA